MTPLNRPKIYKRYNFAFVSIESTQFMIVRIAAVALITALVCAQASAAGQKFSAGFIAVPGAAQAPAMGVWYPSSSVETPGKLGPFDATWAWDGVAADGVFAVVVLSHGNGGRYRNHRDTAATLARNGYIVVAPDHAQMSSPRKVIAAVTHRAGELKTVLSAVRAHPIVGEISHPNRAGAIGFSLGTMTALYAGGTTPQMKLFRQHCKQNFEEDNNFCGNTWRQVFFARVRATLAWLQEKGILKPREENSGPPDPNTPEFAPLETPVQFSAIALVAPVGVPFSADAVQQQNTKLALFRLGDDQQLRYPYHAEYLHTALGKQRHLYKTFDGVHHNAFISPFPKWLLAELEEEGDIEVALDPPNFDRAEFIHEINSDIVDFFNRHL